MLKNFIIIVCLIFSPLAYGKDVTVGLEEGTLTLADFLDACEEAAQSQSSKRIQASIPGKIISIKGIPYEVRYFSFEDTSGQISPTTTFRNYAQKKGLLTMKSAAMTPAPGIHFESFDFRQNPARDGVYFSMAIRKIEK